MLSSTLRSKLSLMTVKGHKKKNQQRDKPHGAKSGGSLESLPRVTGHAFLSPPQVVPTHGDVVCPGNSAASYPGLLLGLAVLAPVYLSGSKESKCPDKP